MVGAAAKYGAVALAVGTTVKLARALWIVPVSIGTALIKHASARIQWPWFIALFCLAAVCNTYLPTGTGAYNLAVKDRKDRSHRNLYLIGTGISLGNSEKSGTSALAARGDSMAPDFGRVTVADKEGWFG